MSRRPLDTEHMYAAAVAAASVVVGIVSAIALAWLA